MLSEEQLAAFRERFPRLPSLGSEWRTEIIAAPDDDALRVVYADWLIERGDPMGELIQLQCRQRASGDPEERARLAAHEVALLSQVVVREQRWRTLRGWIKHEVEALGGTGCVIDRGFVGRCAIGGSQLAANAQRLFEIAPIQALQIERTTRQDLVALATALRHGRVVDLTIESDAERPIDDDALVGFVGVAPLAGVRRLVIAGGVFGPSGLGALLESPNLTQLRALGLEHVRVRPVGGTGWSALGKLERLRLHRCHLGAAALAELASAALEELVELDLSSTAIGMRGAQALAKAMLPRLATLRVAMAGLNAGQLETLARAPGLPALREIDLGEEPVPASVAHVLTSRAAP